MSGIRQGLNLGGRFLGGVGGSALGTLGSLFGLGTSIANKSPGGTFSSLGGLTGFGSGLAQGLGLGTTGATFGGSLAAGGSALANTLTGGAFGTAGNIIGAGAGASGTGLAGGLGAAAGPLGLVGGALGLAGLLTGGFKAGASKKSIKQDAALLGSANRAIRTARITKQPVRSEDLHGFYTSQAVNRQNKAFGGFDQQAIESAGSIIANALNAGINVQPQNGRYIVPLQLDRLTFQAGGRGDPMFGATPSGNPEPFLVSIPASEVKQQSSGRWTTESIIEQSRERKLEAKDRRAQRGGGQRRTERHDD